VTQRPYLNVLYRATSIKYIDLILLFVIGPQNLKVVFDFKCPDFGNIPTIEKFPNCCFLLFISVGKTELSEFVENFESKTSKRIENPI